VKRYWITDWRAAAIAIPHQDKPKTTDRASDKPNDYGDRDRADDSRSRHPGPGPVERDDRENGCGARADAHPDDVGAGERVAQRGLEDRPPDPERGADEDTQQRPRQLALHQDVRRPGDVRTKENPDEVRDRDRVVAKQHPGGEYQHQRQPEPADDHAAAACGASPRPADQRHSLIELVPVVDPAPVGGPF
jgi:hypothetical protein